MKQEQAAPDYAGNTTVSVAAAVTMPFINLTDRTVIKLKFINMETLDFTITILVDQSPKEAFNAINNVRGWWSTAIEGSTDKLNGDFIYHYKDIHYSKIKLIELVPDQKVVWLVLEEYFKFTENKSEWKGTKIIFDISRTDHQTAIQFTHQGLVPQFECYEVCREAWTNYINDSLRSLIATGKGAPSTDGVEGFDEQLVAKWSLV